MSNPDPPVHDPSVLAELDRVSVVYPGGIRALTNISLRVHRGDRVALIGRNGAGKSTLLRLLVGTVIPSTGASRIASSPGWGLPDERSFVLSMTVAENLAYCAERASAPPESVTALLARVGLAGDGLKAVRNCSAGMRSRLAWARALVANGGHPELLLFDELERALDLDGQRELIGSVASLEPHHAVIWATHRPLQGASPELFTRVLALDAGRLVFDGPPSSLPPSWVKA